MNDEVEPREGETFGDYLRRMRVRRGWSQETFAGQLGTKRTYVVQIETGRIKWPAQYVERMAALLGVPLSYLGRAAGRIVSDHPLRGTAIGTSVARGDLTVGKPTTDRNTPDRPALTEAARRFLDGLTDQQRLDLMTFAEEADKVRHFEDYREGGSEETEDESPMAH